MQAMFYIAALLPNYDDQIKFIWDPDAVGWPAAVCEPAQPPSVNPPSVAAVVRPSVRSSSDSDLAFRKLFIFCINYREHKNLIR